MRAPRDVLGVLGEYAPLVREGEHILCEEGGGHIPCLCETMSDFADSEFDYRGAAIYPGPPSSTTSDNSKVVEVLYKSKKTTRGLFKKKSKEVFGGSFER